MKRKFIKLVSSVLAGAMLVTSIGCGSGGDTNEGTDQQNQEEESVNSETGEKIDVVLMIENADEPASVTTIEKIREHFPQYNIISKQWSSDVEQVVKTTFATDSEALDLVMWNGMMTTFTESDMAEDLTPYLEADPEFAGRFLEGALEGAQNYSNGKYYAVPYSCVYPLLEVNLEILDEAGVEWKEAWTWVEFLDACEKIATNTDAYPVGCASGWAGWWGIQAMIQAFSDADEYYEFSHGKIPFTDERVITNMDKVVDLYNSGYMYPGDGAISVSAEEVDMAFANGKLAMRCDVNSVSKGFIDNLDIEASAIAIGSWPTMAEDGPGSVGDRLLGGNNLYFIPSNAKHKEAAWEIMKYIFSDEIQTDYANAGTIICVNVENGVDLSEFAKDSSKVTSDLIYMNSAELSSYMNSSWFSEYLLDKQTAIDTFEEIREGMNP